MIISLPIVICADAVETSAGGGDLVKVLSVNPPEKSSNRSPPQPSNFTSAYVDKILNTKRFPQFFSSFFRPIDSFLPYLGILR